MFNYFTIKKKLLFYVTQFSLSFVDRFHIKNRKNNQAINISLTDNQYMKGVVYIRMEPHFV